MAETEELDWIITEDNKSLTFGDTKVQAVGENNHKITSAEDENTEVNPACTVTPVEAYMSSNLNSKIKS